MAANVLTYSIAREWLHGQVGDERFNLRAFSGGGRGQTGRNAEYSATSFDVFRRTEKDTGMRGGPLPPGLYVCKYVAKHKHFGECVFLEQTVTALIGIDADANIRFYNRGGFFIHGRGSRGSDGCIVPETETERRRLNKAIKNAATAVLLDVTDIGMPLPAARDTATRAA